MIGIYIRFGPEFCYNFSNSSGGFDQSAWMNRVDYGRQKKTYEVSTQWELSNCVKLRKYFLHLTTETTPVIVLFFAMHLKIQRFLFCVRAFDT